MRYVSKHRDVEFIVVLTSGVWKFTIGDQTQGHYGRQEYAIQAAIKRIDDMLFDASKLRRD